MPGIDTYTKLCLHCDGTDESTTITDSSSGGKTVTAQGSAQIDAGVKKFGSGSLYMPGAFDYVSLADSDDWSFGSGDFTLDFWIYFITNTDNDRRVFKQHDSIWSNWGLYFYNDSGLKLALYGEGGSGSVWVASNALTVSTGTWYHFAAVRNGTSFKLYQDGVEVGSGTSSETMPAVANDALLIIGSDDGYWNFDCQLDEVRVSKGVARWTAAFTPPTAAYDGGGPQTYEETLAESFTSSEVTETQAGLPTDGLLTEGTVVSDITDDRFMDSLSAGHSVGDAVTVSVTYNVTLTEGVTGSDSFVLTEGLKFYADNQVYNAFSCESKTGLNFRHEAITPLFSGVSITGAVVNNQKFVKLKATASMKVAYPLSGDERVPPFKGEATMLVGRVFSGDAVAPISSNEVSFFSSVEIDADQDFPILKGESFMTVGGRFTDYVLRYVR